MPVVIAFDIKHPKRYCTNQTDFNHYPCKLQFIGGSPPMGSASVDLYQNTDQINLNQTMFPKCLDLIMIHVSNLINPLTPVLAVTDCE